MSALENVVIEKFCEQIEKQIQLFDTLGEIEKAYTLSRCIRFINVLTHSLNEYQIPIPIASLQKILEERR